MKNAMCGPFNTVILDETENDLHQAIVVETNPRMKAFVEIQTEPEAHRVMEKVNQSTEECKAEIYG